MGQVSEDFAVRGFLQNRYHRLVLRRYNDSTGYDGRADYFQYGIAGGGVYGWQLYDTHYTEMYMDTPEDNPEGYAFTRVWERADKYRYTVMSIPSLSVLLAVND